MGPWVKQSRTVKSFLSQEPLLKKSNSNSNIYFDFLASDLVEKLLIIRRLIDNSKATHYYYYYYAE